MTYTETAAPAATTDVAIDLRWANGVELRLPAANSVEYFAFLRELPEYDFAGYYWGCYTCGKEIPEPQVYCSEDCRRRQS